MGKSNYYIQKKKKKKKTDNYIKKCDSYQRRCLLKFSYTPDAITFQEYYRPREQQVDRLSATFRGISLRNAFIIPGKLSTFFYQSQSRHALFLQVVFADYRQPSGVLRVSAKVFTACTNEVAYPVFLQRYAPVHLSLFSTVCSKIINYL